MGVYTRFKRQPDGFRSLVELLETTPESRRGRMIEVGMTEDPAYTTKALASMIQFSEILALPPLELAEVLHGVQARVIGLATQALAPAERQRLLESADSRTHLEIKEAWESRATPQLALTAQLKIVSAARALERSGRIRLKVIDIGT